MDDDEEILTYYVDDTQDDDSDMDSVHTTTSGFTDHTMSTLTSDAASGTSVHILPGCVIPNTSLRTQNTFKK
jgi:hypothetical protein